MAEHEGRTVEALREELQRLVEEELSIKAEKSAADASFNDQLKRLDGEKKQLLASLHEEQWTAEHGGRLPLAHQAEGQGEATVSAAPKPKKTRRLCANCGHPAAAHFAASGTPRPCVVGLDPGGDGAMIACGCAEFVPEGKEADHAAE